MRKFKFATIICAIAVIATFLLGSHAANMIWDVGVGHVAAFDMFGVGLDGVNKFGRNDDLDTAEESIWCADDLPTEGDGPARCFTNVGATPIDFYVSSDNAADAELEITLELIGNDWSRKIVTMDLGVAAATTGTVYTQIGIYTLLRVNRAYATDDAFTGNIYIHTDVVDGGTDGVPDLPATQIVAVITAGENQTLQACYSVPLGFSAALNQYCASNVSNVGTIDYRIRRTTDGGAVRTAELLTLDVKTHTCIKHDPPIVFVEKTDIEITGDSAGVNATTSATFDLILFPSSFL